MEKKLNEYKKVLIDEFEWLKMNFPTKKISLDELHIYNYPTYEGMNKWSFGNQELKKGISSSVFDKIENGNLELSIFMFIDENYKLSKHDEKLIEKFNIEREHLFVWILYHEFGHILQVYKTYLNGGIESLKKEREDQENLINEILEKYNKGQISKTECDNLYRNLCFEKNADEFANDVYKTRKEKLMSK